jgi:hypothetical protein
MFHLNRMESSKDNSSSEAQIKGSKTSRGSYLDKELSIFVKIFNRGIFFRYSTLLHLPPLRFHCVGGCWDRTQDCYDFGIGSQTL